jgi:uncharacterized protein YggE
MRLSRAPLCAVALLAGLLPAIAQEMPSTPRRPVLTVTGEGVSRAVPDMASFSSGVVSEAKTAREALDANTRAVAAMVAAIKDTGIEARDIATSGFSVQPRYAPPKKDSPDAPQINGYEVRNTVTVRVRDLARLGDLLDKVVTSGANQIGGISFDIAEPAKLEEAARVAAVKEARQQADAIAEAAGVRLVRVLSITSNGTSAPPMPRLMAAPAMMKAEAVPVEAGESEIRASVNVTYEIEPR